MIEATSTAIGVVIVFKLMERISSDDKCRPFSIRTVAVILTMEPAITPANEGMIFRNKMERF
ncbi:hypothetical protein D1872_183250 [compost metagenome]